MPHPLIGVLYLERRPTSTRSPARGPGRAAGPRRTALRSLALASLLLAPRLAAAAVSGSPHDMTLTAADPFTSSCAYCHVPHKAQGEKLWVSTTTAATTGWNSRPIAQLCYSCHESGGGGFGANDMTAHAYSPLAHGYEAGKLPAAPDGSPGALAALPYTDAEFIDCGTCHDPHSGTPPFLRVAGIDALCKGCHGRENTGLVGLENRFAVPGSEAAYSLHPTDVFFDDIAGNGVTNLEPFPAELEVPTASGSWQLGGHRTDWATGTGMIGCQTCHAVHGWGNYPEGRLSGPPGSSLTAIENGGVPSALCESCHLGGGALETVGSGADHPVNVNDGTPVTTYPAGWPAGPAAELTCSTCHDAHGGVAGTSLLRQGGSAAGWCWSCHDRTSIVPDYHHSTKGNDDAAVFTSIVDCEDCHGAAQGLKAHNGFMALQVPAEANRSALCESCHVPQNPLAFDAAAYELATGRTRTFEGAVQPAEHGTPPGTSSHLIDAPDDNRIANCQVKLTPWLATGGVSKYGSAGEVICESCHNNLVNAGNLLGGGAAERRTGGWRANLLLEPYEDNSPGVGVESPDTFPGPTLSALCRGCHYSALPNVDSSFVHNPEAHTVDPYLYPLETSPYGRATLRMMTVPNDPAAGLCPEVSSADRAGAPGLFSYPAPDQMDCDSCHRPHGAHSDSADDGIRRILEFTGPAAHGTVPCLNCHDTDIQCNSR